MERDCVKEVWIAGGSRTSLHPPREARARAGGGLPQSRMRSGLSPPARLPAQPWRLRGDVDFVDFVDFDLLNWSVGFSPCHPQERTGVAVLTRTYEQRTPPAVVQGAAPDSEKPCVPNRLTNPCNEVPRMGVLLPARASRSREA